MTAFAVFLLSLFAEMRRKAVSAVADNGGCLRKDGTPAEKAESL